MTSLTSLNYQFFATTDELTQCWQELIDHEYTTDRTSLEFPPTASSMQAHSDADTRPLSSEENIRPVSLSETQVHDIEHTDSLSLPQVHV